MTLTLIQLFLSPVFLCALLVLLVSVHVTQTQLLLSKHDQRVSTAVPVYCLDLKSTWQEGKCNDDYIYRYTRNKLCL